MSCGHYERFFSGGIGRLWFYNHNGYIRGLEESKLNYIQDIENDIEQVKDQILKKLPNQQIEFNIIDSLA